MTSRPFSVLCASLLLLTTVILIAAPESSLEEKLAERAREHAYRLEYVDGKFFGPAWEMLVADGRSAQFFLLRYWRRAGDRGQSPKFFSSSAHCT